jgi:hypothetical protein
VDADLIADIKFFVYELKVPKERFGITDNQLLVNMLEHQNARDQLAVACDLLERIENQL